MSVCKRQLPQKQATTCVYQRRQPERTAAYQIVQRHLETWLSTAREADPDGNPIPYYVEHDLRKFLECGILAHGFARVRCESCSENFLIAYSCKGRGICPSCNTKRMFETAAHLVEHRFPQVPVRQWVITLPKRLRYFLLRDNELTGRVLQISLRVIERTIREHCPDAPLNAKYGGITYIHRFGSMLNAHLHYHSCLIDGLFARTENGLQFYKTVGLTQKVIQTAQETIRKRVLRLFVRRDLLSSDESEQMQTWENGGGFSLHAQVTIAANDKKGLERLFRYCARPIYAGERLSWQDIDERLIYRLPKPQHDGQTVLRLTPMEFLDRMALLIPPPRCHRHRYHGVLAPNAPLRLAVSEKANLPVNGENAVAEDEKNSVDIDEHASASAYSSIWAMLLAKVFEINPLLCPSCGGEMKIIAFVTETKPIGQILRHIGELDHAPAISPARDPPIFCEEIDQTQYWDDHTVNPTVEYEFDQTVSW